jgi:hypothetical protein
MAAVLAAMAVTTGLQRDFYVSCVTLSVAIGSYFLLSRSRQPKLAQSDAG